MLLHDIAVHLFMPAGIDSPGFKTEQEHKPAPTKKLEEGDQVLSPETVAGHLFRGESRAQNHSPTDWTDWKNPETARFARCPAWTRRRKGILTAGLDKGYYQPTSYFITELMRMSTKGGVPGNNPLMDIIYWIGSGVSGPLASHLRGRT